MPSHALARRAAAYAACVQLHDVGELDNMMLPLGKESVLPPVVKIDWEETIRPGTTKRRQYYYKRVSTCLTKVEKEGEEEEVSVSLASKCVIDDTKVIDVVENSSSHSQSLPQRSTAKMNIPVVEQEEVTIEDCDEDPENNVSESLADESKHFKNGDKSRYYEAEEDPALVERFRDASVLEGRSFSLYCLR